MSEKTLGFATVNISERRWFLTDVVSFVTHTSSTVLQFLICHHAAKVKLQTPKLPNRIITEHPSLPKGFSRVKVHSHFKTPHFLHSQYDTCYQQDSNTVHCAGKQETKLNVSITNLMHNLFIL